MKIWKSYSGEHSAKLKIIGTFKTPVDAQKAVACFNELLAVENKEKGDNSYFSDEIMEVLRKHNSSTFSEIDVEQLDYFYKLHADGNKIVVETDELDIQVLIKLMINYGAKIELFSRHDYPIS